MVKEAIIYSRHSDQKTLQITSLRDTGNGCIVSNSAPIIFED